MSLRQLIQWWYEDEDVVFTRWSYRPPAATISGTVRLRFLMKATNWNMTPEWCCTLYTKPKLTTTCREDTPALKDEKKIRVPGPLTFIYPESKSPASSLPVCAAAQWAPPGPWGPASPAGWQRSSVWWGMWGVAPGPADSPSVRCTCTASATGCNDGGEISAFMSEYTCAAAGLIIFTEGPCVLWALTLLVDSEKLQNFASTSRLVSFSHWSK